MRVLECFGEPILSGGQESFVFNTVQQMHDPNLEIDAYTPYNVNNDYYVNILTQRGGQVFSDGVRFNPGGLRFSIIRPLIELLKSQHYDVIHIHSGSISVLAFASFAAKVCGVGKIIVHSHASGIKKSLKYKITKLAMTPLLSLCPTIYFACSLEAGEWKFSKRIVKNKLQIIKNGIDIPKYQFNSDTRSQLRKQLQIDDSEIVIGHVGRLSYEKNQRFLIDLVSEIVSDHSQYRLLLVGEGDDKESLTHLVEEKHLQSHVIFAGAVNNVYDYLMAMDVFAFPSLYEGLGLVGIEAQASGLHVIASSNVPRTLNATNTVDFIDLSNREEWIYQLEKVENHTRFDKSNMIKSAGFDVKKTAELLSEIYLGE